MHTARARSAPSSSPNEVNAEAFLGQMFEQAVITVPAYFLNVCPAPSTRMRGASRPRYASHHQLAHSRGSRLWPGQEGTLNIAFYELGGGRLIFPFVRSGYGVGSRSNQQRRHLLGGEDFDKRINRLLADKSSGRRPESTSSMIDCNCPAPQGPAEKPDRASITTPDRRHPCPFTATRNGPKPSGHELTPRQSRSYWVYDLIQRTVAPCKAALRDAGLHPSDITKSSSSAPDTDA